MIGGCVRDALALVGCATLLVIGGVVAFQYRSEIGGAVFGREGGQTAAGNHAIGIPSDEALRTARAKAANMALARGPAYVVLSADEMAALIVAGLHPAARAALDSLTVVLSADRFALHAILETAVFGRDLLGPFEGMLREREPLEVAGPARFDETGVLAWRPDHFRVRSFPFPQVLVPRLVDRVTGRDDGGLPVLVPGTVADVRIAADGVTFYRRTH